MIPSYWLENDSFFEYNYYSMLRQKIDKYFEKPVTFDEKQIASLIDTMTSAIMAGNLQNLMSVISESARIAAAADDKRVFNKKEFEEHMTVLIPMVKHFSCFDIYIRTDGKNGTISCLAHTVLKNGFSKTISRYFQCQKESGKWLLTEAGYTNPLYE